MQKFETLRQPILGFWITVPREEEKKNLPKMVTTFVYASSQGQRRHSARTKKKNVPKIVATFVSANSQGQHTHSARTKIHEDLGVIHLLQTLMLSNL